MYKLVNEKLEKISDDETREINSQIERWKAEDKNQPLSESEVFTLFAKQQINTLSVDDNTALRMKSYYPTWQELVDRERNPYSRELTKPIQAQKKIPFPIKST